MITPQIYTRTSHKRAARYPREIKITAINILLNATNNTPIIKTID
jgi:hypothetical protein